MAITQDSIRKVVEAVRRYGGNEQAARALGVPRSYVRRRMERAKQAAVPEKPRVRVPYSTEPVTFTSGPPSRPEPLYSPDPAPSPANSSTIRVLVAGDLHDDPHLPKDRFSWIGQFAADIAPDRIVQIGDICDLESLSFHSGNDTDSGRYKPRFMADMDSLREAMDLLTDPIEKAGVKAPRLITLGNHENRAWRFENAAPEVSGMLQRDLIGVLGGRGWSAHEYGKYIEIGRREIHALPTLEDGKAYRR